MGWWGPLSQILAIPALEVLIRFPGSPAHPLSPTRDAQRRLPAPGVAPQDPQRLPAPPCGRGQGGPRGCGTCPSDTCQRAGKAGVNPGLAAATKVSDAGCLPAFGSRRLSCCEHLGTNWFLIFFSSSWTVSLGSLARGGAPGSAGRPGCWHLAVLSREGPSLPAAKPGLELTALPVWASAPALGTAVHSSVIQEGGSGAGGF